MPASFLSPSDFSPVRVSSTVPPRGKLKVLHVSPGRHGLHSAVGSQVRTPNAPSLAQCDGAFVMMCRGTSPREEDGMDQDPEGPDKERGETEAEREDRKFDDLLQELRVMQTSA